MIRKHQWQQDPSWISSYFLLPQTHTRKVCPATADVDADCDRWPTPNGRASHQNEREADKNLIKQSEYFDIRNYFASLLRGFIKWQGCLYIRCGGYFWRKLGVSTISFVRTATCAFSSSKPAMPKPTTFSNGICARPRITCWPNPATCGPKC